MTRKRHVFVLALTDQQRRQLETTRDAGELVFHGLLDYASAVRAPTFEFDELLGRARAELAAFGGSVDAIVCPWDFPPSVLAPILAEEHGLPSPTLRSVLMCEHKYWSRVEQLASVPGCVPRFAAFDPFRDDALDQIDLPFPFWVKPVKAHSSELGFEVGDPDELHRALDRIRAGIGAVGRPFDQALAHVDLPPEIRGHGGMTCLAEQLVPGIQAAPEGTMFRGTFGVHGIFDMGRDPSGHRIEGLDYPAASLPAEVQERMVDVAERYLRHVGFDDGCFNAEFLWDEATEALWLIEVNTRMSQSHSELFVKVDGMTNHQVVIDIALGRRPSLPRRRGGAAVASKRVISHEGDGVVRRIPGAPEVAAVSERFPGTHVHVYVRPGDRLSELPHQDSYRYVLANVYLGADDRTQLEERYRTCLDLLRFEIAPVGSERVAVV
jgi:hypothetical protein